MQASRGSWTPPGGTLGRILEETRRRVTSLEGAQASGAPDARPAGTPSLAKALRGKTVAVIAELKRRSPSKGTLNDGLDPARQASAFVKGGAAAVSVLTEPTFFGGSLDDLITIRGTVKVPVLRKDFHIDPLQLVEARGVSATAVLLIARALEQAQLVKLMEFAGRLGLETVVEVRDEAELERALDAGAAIVGVNSRNLETLEVDETVPERLMPQLPAGVIGIWESGVHDVDAVRRAAAAGADAVLVGSALSKATDPAGLVRELGSVPREPRRG